MNYILYFIIFFNWLSLVFEFYRCLCVYYMFLIMFLDIFLPVLIVYLQIMTILFHCFLIALFKTQYQDKDSYKWGTEGNVLDLITGIHTELQHMSHLMIRFYGKISNVFTLKSGKGDPYSLSSYSILCKKIAFMVGMIYQVKEIPFYSKVAKILWWMVFNIIKFIFYMYWDNHMYFSPLNWGLMLNYPFISWISFSLKHIFIY